MGGRTDIFPDEDDDDMRNNIVGSIMVYGKGEGTKIHTFVPHLLLRDNLPQPPAILSDEQDDDDDKDKSLAVKLYLLIKCKYLPF